jgi:serine phosphatase RsbU (regulator of sigma subunit)
LPDSRIAVSRVACVCAAAAIVFAAWVLTANQINAGIAFFYAVPVGLATWWWGRRGGAAAFLACMALYAIGGEIHPIPDFAVAFGLRLAAFAGIVALVSLARERLTMLEHSAEELEAIRAALTPAALPELSGVDAAAAFIPSHYGVSGDFYLLTNGPDGSAVAIVGDVAGHGPKAARLATFIRARFAAMAASTSDPAELLELANAALTDRPGGELVSAVCLRFLSADSRLTWAAAGHPPPLKLPGLEELTAAGSTYLLGAEPGLGVSNRETSLAPGEGVFAYTDGATDVRGDGAMLGLEGLLRLLEPLAGLPAEPLVRQAEKAILDWTTVPIRDDLCLLALKAA